MAQGLLGAHVSEGPDQVAGPGQLAVPPEPGHPEVGDPEVALAPFPDPLEWPAGLSCHVGLFVGNIAKAVGIDPEAPLKGKALMSGVATSGRTSVPARRSRLGRVDYGMRTCRSFRGLSSPG